jgi:hypothetical protein
VVRLFSRILFLRAALVCALALAFAGVSPRAAQAQDQAAMSGAFEGKQVIVLIDMPGTQKGVNVYPQRPNPFDANEYGKQIKGNPVALRVGDVVMITKVKVGGKNIEFQLGGGGYGTAGDNTDTAVHFTPADKSRREKDLQDQINNTDDPDQRRYLQRQLDDIRRQRERDDRRNQQIAQDDAARRTQQVTASRMTGGSRFNLNYNGKVPAEITPHDVMAALAQWVSFPIGVFGDQHIPNQTASSNQGGVPPPPDYGGTQTNDPNHGNTAVAPGNSVSVAPAAGGDPLHSLAKGMKLEDVHTLLGSPASATDSDHDGLTVHTEIFERSDATVTCAFVNGVLVTYNIAVH